MHEQIDHRWVKNLPERHLSHTELTVLSRGLNYARTLNKILYEEFILATELACQSMKDQGKKAELKNDIAGILQTAKLAPGNINKEEREDIHSLKKDKTIMIIPADKGRATAVMDTKRYEQQMEGMLKDTETYKKIKKHLKEDKKKALKALMKPLLVEGKLDKDTYNLKTRTT